MFSSFNLFILFLDEVVNDTTTVLVSSADDSGIERASLGSVATEELREGADGPSEPDGTIVPTPVSHVERKSLINGSLTQFSYSP